MSKKLFVGGLSWTTNDDGLRQAFARFGDIDEAKVIFDRETGRSRGFGFVTFADDEAASDALAQLNGASIDGRTIKVNEAQEKPRTGGGFGGGRGGSLSSGGSQSSGSRGREGGFENTRDFRDDPQFD